MTVAGIGCRRGCTADDIVAVVRSLGGAEVLVAPEWKRDEPGLREAATLLGVPLRFVSRAELVAVQPLCLTRSSAALRAVGVASVAEAAALAAGGRLLRPRVVRGMATAALAEMAAPPLTQPSPKGRGLKAAAPPLLLPLPLGEGRGEGPARTP